MREIEDTKEQQKISCNCITWLELSSWSILRKRKYAPDIAVPDIRPRLQATVGVQQELREGTAPKEYYTAVQ